LSNKHRQKKVPAPHGAGIFFLADEGEMRRAARGREPVSVRCAAAP